MEYCSLHNHSDYSNIRGLDSTNSLDRLLYTSIEKGIKGVALTDHETLSGHIKWIELVSKLKKENKIPQDFKAILGNEIYLCRDNLNLTNYQKDKDGFWHFILLALDTEGHKQLRELSSRAWEHSFKQFIERVPTYYSDIEEIIGDNKGHIVATTACLGSYFDKLILRKDYEQAKKFVAWAKFIFGNENFFVEFQPGTSLEQKTFNIAALSFCKENDINFIITTDAHYPLKEDREIHKAFLTSNQVEREVDAFYESTYVMSSEEIKDNMSYFSLEDIEKSFSNTLKIMDRVQEYNLFQKQIIPRIPFNLLPSIKSNLSDYGRKEIAQYLNSPWEDDKYFIARALGRMQELHIDDTAHINRLCEEIDEMWVVSEKIEERLSAYFVTVSKIIDLGWSEADTIVGTWRGSVGALLFAYLLDIIQEDPLNSPIDLPYWRCISRGRAELADVDFDSQASKRENYFKVISDFFNSIGGQAVGVATFGTTTSKSALQTAARGLGYSPEIGTYLSSLIPSDRGFVRGLLQCYNGDEEKDFNPIPQFIREMKNYPDIWNVAKGIEGLISRRGTHSAGIIITNFKTIELAPTMKSPSGLICTQYELHDSEKVGLIKYDMLTVDALDKIRTCMDLLVEYGYMEWQGNLKSTYDKYLLPNKLNYTDTLMWEMAINGKISSLFQFETAVGAQTLKVIKPNTLLELSQCNSLMRLIPEKGQKTPTEEFSYYKENPDCLKHDIWELIATEEEKEILLKFLTPYNGVISDQEGIMRMTMLPFTKYDVTEANKVRKTIAKKQTRDIESTKKTFLERGQELGTSEDITSYLWDVQAKKSMGYGFSIIHSTGYSLIALQEMNLAYFYPTIYWNTACLIVDSDGLQDEDEDNEEENENGLVETTETTETTEIVDIYEPEDFEEYEYEDLPDKKSKIKKKKKPVKYGKISSAIGKMRDSGIIISPPDINHSKFTFTPNEEKNEILYGLKGITRINSDMAKEIIANRPYIDINDFFNKIKTSKLQAINLIKSGAFDNLGNRENLFFNYLHLIAGEKSRLTLQNLPTLINRKLIPDEYSFEEKLFNFNKDLKKHKTDDFYCLDEYALNFYLENFPEDKLDSIFNNESKILQKEWDKIYKKTIERIRPFINNKDTLSLLNNSLFEEVEGKYGKGNISKWEMDSIGFYYHEHELNYLNLHGYNIDNFYELSEEPRVKDSFYTDKGQLITIYELNRICGTVIEKDKLKNIVTLLTQYGVVKVKIYRNQFSKYDRQLSEKDEETGKKHILERSWFTRGNLIIVTGIRRDDFFIPKVYKNTPYAPIEIIKNIDYDTGTFNIIKEREE